MRSTFVVIALLVGLGLHAQDEVFSFYFDKSVLSAFPEATSVDEKYFGKYEISKGVKNDIRKSAGEYLILDDSGIYIEKNRISHISREEVRENSQYLVRKGWLHGVVENDSIPCMLEGEDYYFLVPVKTYLFEAGVPPHKLLQFDKNNYGLFSYEDVGHYSVVVVNCNGNKVELKEIDFTKEGERSIDKIEEISTLETDQEFKTYLLEPTKQEWVDFILKKCLDTYDVYSKIKEED